MIIKFIMDEIHNERGEVVEKGRREFMAHIENLIVEKKESKWEKKKKRKNPLKFVAWTLY